jgi:hypothetical protein
MSGRWYPNSRRMHIFLWKGNENHELGTGAFMHKRVCCTYHIIRSTLWASEISNYCIMKYDCEG